MLKQMLVVFALTVSAAAANELPPGPLGRPSESAYLAEIKQDRQNRIRALIKRGKAASYEQLVRIGIPRSSFRFGALSENPNSMQTLKRVDLEEDIKLRSAINLAALGFTSSDVANFRKSKVDLFGVSDRVFSAAGTPEDKLVLADNVVVATAIKSDAARARLDGFRSALIFKVTKRLKGSLDIGDRVSIPQISGPNPDGTYTESSQKIDVTPGKSYVLVLSKNWYEQNVAEGGKQPEIDFNALSFLIYETTGEGMLLNGPIASRNGRNPSDINSIETTLSRLPEAHN